MSEPKNLQGKFLTIASSGLTFKILKDHYPPLPDDCEYMTGIVEDDIELAFVVQSKPYPPLFSIN